MRKINTLLLILLPLFSFGQQTINDTITHDGLQRDYILYIPDSYDANTSTPLVFNFHGYTSNAFQQMWYGDFRSISDEEGFIIVHPNGTLDNSGSTHWNVGWGGSTVDDVGFADALIDSLSEEYNIDLERVYSTGMSNGGFMSYQLACQLSNRFAAIASVTGSMLIGQFNTCNAIHPTPVMQIHGTNDNSVPYGDNSFTESIPGIMDFWVEFNSCNTEPLIINVPNTNITDDCTAEHSVWNGGNNGVRVELYKIINGGHSWPGTSFPNGVTNQDIDASEKIWEFFSQYNIYGEMSTTFIRDEVTHVSKKLVKIIDPLGRESTMQFNTPLFFIYEDGSVEKNLFIE